MEAAPVHPAIPDRVPAMYTVYDTIYKKLLKIIPDMIAYIDQGKTHGKSVVDESGALMDLNFDFLRKGKQDSYIIALSHYFEMNGDLVPDPDMEIRVFPELEQAEAMTYQDQYGYQYVYEEKKGKELVNLKRKKELNHFLNQWLSNIIAQGHSIDLSKEEDEEDEKAEIQQKEKPKVVEEDVFRDDMQQELTPKRPEFNPLAVVRMIDENPSFRKMWEVSYDLKTLKGRQFTPKEYDALHAFFGVMIVELAQQESRYREYLGQVQGQTFMVKESSEKEVAPSESVEEEEKAEIKSKESDTPSEGLPAIATDLKYRETFLPNVLVPAGGREPFLSQDFSLYEMGSVIKKEFPHLLSLTSSQFPQMAPLDLFYLMQLHHPDEYGIAVSRMKLLKEWERRGKEIFEALGFPTDPSYPYMNIYQGYEAVEPLSSLIVVVRTEGNEWWAAAEHTRPVADAQKGIAMIDELIKNKKEEQEDLINPRTGKPWVDNKKLHKDLEFSIRYLEESKGVLQNYLKQSTGSSSPENTQLTAAFIGELENAYWKQEDEKYPVDKVTLRGQVFHSARLREAIGRKLEKLPLSELYLLVDELKTRFKERRPLSTYEKSAVTGNKKGDKKTIALMSFYIDDMIIDNDLFGRKEKSVMDFLLTWLFKDAATLVDLPVQDEKARSKKQQAHERNKTIEKLIEQKQDGTYTQEEKELLKQYTGSGGLIQQGASGKGVLYEYYTPDEVVQKMWGLALKHGYDEGSVLEPAAGIGNFLKYAFPTVPITAFEINPYAAKIIDILYPHVKVYNEPFESLFFSGNIHLKDKTDKIGSYSLVIGNPPYGEFSGKYAGMGEKKWTGAQEYETYFVLRCLMLLKSKGLLVFLVPNSFLSTWKKEEKVKSKIAAMADLVDAYRLPVRTFAMTDIGTDLIVLQKK